MRSSSTTKAKLLTLTAALAAAIALILVAGCPSKKPKYPSCDGDKDCKAGEICFQKKCVQCRSDDDCEPGQQCRANACVAKDGWCNGDEDCPDFKVCRQNQCVPCQSDADCEGGRCSDGACLRSGDCVKNQDCAEDEDCVDNQCKRTRVGSSDTVDCDLNAAYFDFDTATISANTRAVLDSNVSCLETTQRAFYLIGHTDPRGTDEYNIALSDGRARAAADYIGRLGIDSSRVHVIPKGEAEATGSNEASWTQDRRVEFVWK